MWIVSSSKMSPLTFEATDSSMPDGGGEGDGWELSCPSG